MIHGIKLEIRTASLLAMDKLRILWYNVGNNKTKMEHFRSMARANNNRADRGANRKRGNTSDAPKTREVLAKELRLKPRTKAFVDKLIEEPNISNTEAWIQTHETNDRKSASVSASKVLAKANVQIYKDSAISKAKRAIVSLVDSDNENIRLKASTEILDRALGKSVQRNESTTRTVSVQLDISGVKLGGHAISAPSNQELTS